MKSGWFRSDPERTQLEQEAQFVLREGYMNLDFLIEGPFQARSPTLSPRKSTMTSQMSRMSFVSEQMGHSLEDSFRRQGSLPFKKRKLYHAFPLGYAPESSNVSYLDNDNEKFAALALVAAATSTLPVTPSYPGLLSPSSSYEGASQLSMHLIQDESGRESVELQQRDDPQLVSPGGGDASNMKGSAQGRQRIHHPPLAAPLPGGCHGRTSRNNSYCRRHPCYNGSKYCKLHYQQYIVAGIRAPTESTSSETSSVVADSGSGRTTPTPSAHQDKRFTGCGDEVRCLATTTRGRACAYVCVNDTKYCYLHADYDTNPPPRRGGCNSSSKARPKLEATVSASGDEMVGSTTDTPVAQRSTFETALLKTPNAAPPSVTSDESSFSSSAWVTPAPSSSGVLSTHSKETMSEDPKREVPEAMATYRLLSSISSDEWFDKLVMVSTGPFANRTGRVVRWGNGWVTIRLSEAETDGLMHNRRSVELFVLPDEEESEGQTLQGGAQRAPVRSAGGLRRCVSQETDASTSGPPKIPRLDTHWNVSVVSSESDNIETANDANESVKYDINTVQDIAQAVTSDAVDEIKTNKSRVVSHGDGDGDDGEVKKPAGDDDAAVQKGVVHETQSPASVKSCRSISSEEKALPLVESLMLAQEGRRKHLDLLFGTAALERGRRKLHKPARYEDKAMLVKARSRRSSESDAEGANKTQRPENSPRNPRKSPSKFKQDHS